MKGLLLDTHILIWWLEDSPKLRSHVKNQINDPANDVYVSAVSTWEIATKHRNGKLQNVAEFVKRSMSLIVEEGFTALPINHEHANRAGLLDVPHRDPFDRMLAAQALIENLTLITADQQLKTFDVRILWN